MDNTKMKVELGNQLHLWLFSATLFSLCLLFLYQALTGSWLFATLFGLSGNTLFVLYGVNNIPNLSFFADEV